ncbi:MAG: hypothetical protein ABI145_12780 [Steroidobacteraceae bacterium]
MTSFGPTVSFAVMNSKRKVTVEDGDNIVFEGMGIDELNLGEPALQAYAEEYGSTELEATYKLVVENGVLNPSQWMECANADGTADSGRIHHRPIVNGDVSPRRQRSYIKLNHA